MRAAGGGSATRTRRFNLVLADQLQHACANRAAGRELALVLSMCAGGGRRASRARGVAVVLADQLRRAGGGRLATSSCWRCACAPPALAALRTPAASPLCWPTS